MEQIFFRENFIQYLTDEEFERCAKRLIKDDIYKQRSILIEKKKSAIQLEKRCKEFNIDFNFDCAETVDELREPSGYGFFIEEFIKYLFEATHLDPLEPKYNFQSNFRYFEGKIVNSSRNLSKIFNGHIEENDFTAPQEIITIKRVCPVYRMNSYQRYMMRKNCPHAKALIY